MKSLRYAWLLVVLLVLAACGQDVAPDTLQATDTATPTVTSDKEDYAPGELVTLTGSNWQAGESVHINVDDDQTKTWVRNVDVTADENGNITNQFNLPNWFVATYKVTATGETSSVATTSFTDANVQAKANLPGTATTKVKWVLYNTKNCTGTEVAKSAAQGVSLTGSTASGLTGASKDQSLKLTAEASSSDNKAFDKWTDANGTTLVKLGSDVTATCQTDFNNGEGIVTFTANYAVAPVAVNTTTTLASSANPSVFGQSVTFTATVAAASGNNAPTGTVTFKNGTTTLGTGTLSQVDGTTNKASATFGTSSLAVSTAGHSITAEYGGATGFNTSTSSPALNQVINKAATSTALQSSQNPSTEGQSVTFTAAISATSPGTGTASGNVQFKVDGSNAGNPVALNNSAQAAFTTSSLAVGSRSITAEYLGSSSYSGSTSAALSQTINAACITPSILQQPASVTATVGGAAAFSVTAGGTSPLSYQWLKGDTNIQGATSASYDLTAVTTADAGNYSVKVTNSCGTATSNAATLTVNKASATISLGNLTHTYDGSAKSATATTSPEKLDGLSISYSQNGKAVGEPTNAGSYVVVAKLDNPSYSAEDATGTLVIDKADQAISWDAPATITYGDALGDDQLNAARTTGDGTLSYDPSAGTILGAGSHTLKVTAAETDNYKATSKEVSITVNKAEQAISWSNPAAITYDTPLGAAQLNASLTKGDGELSYDPPAGTLLNVGTHTLKVTAAETDNYKAASAEVSIKVNKVEQVIVWSNPAAITYGTPLSETQLNASLSKGDGDLSYSPALGALLPVGIHTLTVDAAETANSYAASKQVSITVNKADQTISFTGAPAAAVFGSRFTVSAAGGASGEPVVLGASGACTISGSEVTMTSGTGTCSLTANQDGNDNYNAARQATQSTTAQKADQAISWSNPAPIIYGTALGATQLNATLTTGDGTLSYSPAAGTVLGVGNQTLRVEAAATTNYNVTSREVSITVTPWTLRGFYSPVDMGIRNNAKGGSTVPLKFEVFAGSAELTSTSAIKTFTQKFSCTATTGDDIEQYATGGTSLRYDTTAGQFIFNWQTPRQAGACYRVTVETQDGSKMYADFQLR